jgi:hypothetical protein
MDHSLRRNREVVGPREKGLNAANLALVSDAFHSTNLPTAIVSLPLDDL